MKLLFSILPALLLAACLVGQNPVDPFVVSDTTSLQTIEQKATQLYVKGKYREAADLAATGLQRAELLVGKDDLEYGNLLDLLGTALHAAGRWKEAMTYLEAAVEHGRVHLGEDHADYVTRLSNLGMLYLDMGDRGKAIAMLELAVEKGKVAPGEDHPDYSIMVNNLAVAYDQVGYNAKALEYYWKSAALTEKAFGKEHAKYAQRLRNIAKLQHELGHDDEALPLLQQALAIYEKTVGKEHPQYLSGLFLLVQIYMSQKKPSEALANTDTLVRLGEKVRGRLHPEFSKYLRLRGSVLSSLNRNQEAKSAYEEAEQIDRQLYATPVYNGSFTLNLSLGRINALLNDVPEATRRFALLVEIVRFEIANTFDAMNQSDQENYLADRAQGLADVLCFSLNHPAMTTLNGSVYDLNLAVKGLTLGYRRQLLESLRLSGDSAIVSDFYAWKSIGVSLSQQYSLPESKRSADFPELQRRSEALERQLAVGSAAFREARGQTGWKDVQQALGDDEAAIEFCHFDFNKSTFRAKGDSTVYVALLLRKNDPEPRIVYLFEEKQLGNLRATRDLYAPPGRSGGPARLNQLVWQPLAEHLNGIRTIYYSPSGILHRVNFGAIPLNEKETVSDRFRLFELGSTGQLARTRDAHSYDNRNMLVFGGIDYAVSSGAQQPVQQQEPPATLPEGAFRALRDDDWPYLAWTAKEADDIAGIAGKAGMATRILKGREATEENFKQIGRTAPSPRVLHLATHGYFFPDADSSATTGFQASAQPLIRSGLILAGANAAWKGEALPPGGEDGILTAYEIAQMDLSHTELVVLSACQTGLGDLQGNEGVFGLQRAFKMAGAHYVIMSLWSVSDQEVYEFMEIFYRQWLERGQDIPSAYQYAQNQMRKKFDRPFNPSMWAGFVLIQ